LPEFEDGLDQVEEDSMGPDSIAAKRGAKEIQPRCAPLPAMRMSRCMPTTPLHRDLLGARILTLGVVALAIPVGALAVFVLGADRSVAADVIAWAYSLGLFLSFTTAWWPLKSLRAWDRERRARSTALLFLGMSYVTHLTWELGWLLLLERIEAARDAWWAYPWWAYIDGGDARYAAAPPELLGMETLSVLNGVCGLAALVWLRRTEQTGERNGLPILVLMGTAVVHLYSASLYYLSELFAGMPNVNTHSFTDTWIKFGLANAPWVVVPPLVLWWGAGTLGHRRPPST